MNKKFKKVVKHQSSLESKSLNHQKQTNIVAYNIRRDYYVNLFWRQLKCYFQDLDTNCITDSRRFQKSLSTLDEKNDWNQKASWYSWITKF